MALTTLSLVLGCPVKIVHHVSEQRVTPFVRGVGLGLFASDAQYNYGHLLDEIVALGATDVLVVVPWYQSDLNAIDIAPRLGFSPSWATVEKTLAQAQARRLRVAVLPIVRLKRRGPKEWRGVIAPTAGVSRWFDVYRPLLLRLATIAKKTKVARLGIGSELLSLEAQGARWRRLAGEVRKHFSGRLFYSANWDHFAQIPFWDAVDDAGVTAYFELTTLDPAAGKAPSLAELTASWRGPRIGLNALSAQINKPVLLTEIGYPSRSSAARYPWDETRQAPIDLGLQAKLVKAFCAAFAADPGPIDGFYYWNWFGFGGPTDGGYTPRGKPAAKILSECLRQPWEKGSRHLRRRQ